MKRASRIRVNRRHMLFFIIIIVVTGVIGSCKGPDVTLIEGNRQSLPTIVPNIDKNPSPAQVERYTIVIDAGHGGHDPGAEGNSGNWEQDYTLSLSKKVFDLLQQDERFEAHLTRKENTSVDLLDRVDMANTLGADAFLSIHGNTYIDSSVSGTETYYYTDESFAFANEVHKRLVEGTGFKDRGVKKDEWKVLVGNNSPAILLEVGFLTSDSDESAMLSDEHQNETAQAIVDGIKSYFLNK